MPCKSILTLAALLIDASAALMLTKTLPYYTCEKSIHFLTTKSDETNDNLWFRLAFYHEPGGVDIRVGAMAARSG